MWDCLALLHIPKSSQECQSCGIPYHLSVSASPFAVKKINFFLWLVQLLIIFQQGCRLLLHWYISSQIPSLVWGKAVVVYFPLWIWKPDSGQWKSGPVKITLILKCMQCIHMGLEICYVTRRSITEILVGQETRKKVKNVQSLRQWKISMWLIGQKVASMMLMFPVISCHNSW